MADRGRSLRTRCRRRALDERGLAMSMTKRLLFDELGWKGWSIGEGPKPLPPEIVAALKREIDNEKPKYRTKKRKAKKRKKTRKRRRSKSRRQ